MPGQSPVRSASHGADQSRGQNLLGLLKFTLAFEWLCAAIMHRAVAGFFALVIVATPALLLLGQNNTHVSHMQGFTSHQHALLAKLGITRFSTSNYQLARTQLTEGVSLTSSLSCL